jgi:AraC-like DNA-binding protein
MRNRRLSLVVDWPVEAAACSFQVQNIATKFGVSARTVARHFLEVFNKPPKQCLDEWRVDAARQELRRGELVKNAASAAQVADLANFNRLFKRIEGIPPKNFPVPRMSETDKKCPTLTNIVVF